MLRLMRTRTVNGAARNDRVAFHLTGSRTVAFEVATQMLGASAMRFQKTAFWLPAGLGAAEVSLILKDLLAFWLGLASADSSENSCM